MKAIIDDIDFLIDEVDLFPVTPPTALISEWVGARRILPPNTPFPGLWSNTKTPYCVEIMDNMSPLSPIQRSAIMKGAQLGLTASAENIIAYFIGECPAEILYISATEHLLEKWATKRLEPLIDSCNLRRLIFAQIDNPKSRRSGDKIFFKAFVGGNLDMASAQSASGLRSDSKRVLIRDEIDGAPKMLRTGEGNWYEVSDARTNAWGGRKKILDISTPTTFGDSLINDIYEAGDKRKFLIPCPLCGKYQELEFGSDQSQQGLKGDFKAGILQHSYYICDFCHDAIFNHHKSEMLTAGRWEPSSTSHDPCARSYQLGSLYSPIGMLSWTELYRKYIEASETPDGMRSFANLYLGLPFKESGSRPKLENVIELRGGYRQGTVPKDVLYLTAGIDVQRGSLTDIANPPRLEMEVVGHGAGYKRWSITYRRFEGAVDDPYAGAWESLNEFAVDGGMTFKREDGREFMVALLLVDSGDGNLTDVVYRFTQRWQNTFPSKGFGALRRHKAEKGDEAGPANFRRYRAVRINEATTLIEMSTNYYKTLLYNNLRVPRLPAEPQRAGFCDFPVDYPETYFQMLTAEEKRSDGSFHCPSGRRNEAMDCRVMALCAADFWLDSMLLDVRAAAKERGAKPAAITLINHRTVIEMLARQVEKKS